MSSIVWLFPQYISPHREKDKNRDYSLDIFKTMLVIGMVWAHCWQFMHYEHNRIESLLSIYINVISFSGFMFAFGRASQLAYLSKPKEKVRHKLIINFITLLIVYYISGYGFHFLVEKHQSLYSCIKILLLWDVPGYSEFLLSFAFLMLIILFFFETIIKIASSRKLIIIAIFFSLVCSFLPYQYIKIPILGVFIGCQEFSCFPLVQYSMFYFVGVYLQSLDMKIKWYYVLASILISMIGVSYTIIEHKLGNRFPPSIFWLVLAWFPIICYTLICNKIRGGVGRFVRQIGRHTLFFLLGSNIIIFSAYNIYGNNFSSFNILLFSVTILIICYFLSIILDYIQPIIKGIHKNGK